MRENVGPRWTVRGAAALALWTAALIAAIGLFRIAGDGPLAPPPLLRPGGWAAWATGRDPMEMVFALLRLGVLAAAWYLLGVTTIGVLARALRAARLVAVADLLTVPLVRRLLQAALGMGLAAAAVTSLDATTPAHPFGTVVALTTDLRVSVAAGDERATMRHLPDPEKVPALIPADGPAGLPGGAGAREPSHAERPRGGSVDPPATPRPRLWQVEPGEHLWGIAEQVLAEAWGRAPTAADIVPYWRRLIESNRQALADPDNPDLVFPGQVFTVPDAPAGPTGGHR